MTSRPALQTLSLSGGLVLLVAGAGALMIAGCVNLDQVYDEYCRETECEFPEGKGVELSLSEEMDLVYGECVTATITNFETTPASLRFTSPLDRDDGEGERGEDPVGYFYPAAGCDTSMGNRDLRLEIPPRTSEQSFSFRAPVADPQGRLGFLEVMSGIDSVWATRVKATVEPSQLSFGSADPEKDPEAPPEFVFDDNDCMRLEGTLHGALGGHAVEWHAGGFLSFYVANDERNDDDIAVSLTEGCTDAFTQDQLETTPVLVPAGASFVVHVRKPDPLPPCIVMIIGMDGVGEGMVHLLASAVSGQQCEAL